MFFKTLTYLTLTALPAVAVADTDPIPVWCCPDFCNVADETAVLMPRGDASGEYDLILDGKPVPVLPDAFRGIAQDHPMQYCMGYDPFGDRQIKCLFIPSII
jgi:hypothetical protein